jgi:hypothetical protein
MEITKIKRPNEEIKWVDIKIGLPEIGKDVLLRLKKTHWKRNHVLHTVASLEKYENRPEPYFENTEDLYEYDLEDITHWCEIPTLLNGDE